MTKEPTKAEVMAKQRMMEWKANNRKFRQEAAARRSHERAAEKSRESQKEGN